MPPFQISARARGGGSISCPLCRESLAGAGAVRECPDCEVSYHGSCLEELGGCGTLGCERAKRIVAAPRTPAPSRAAPRETMSWRSAGVLALIILVSVGIKVGEHMYESEVTPARRARVVHELDPYEAERFARNVERLVQLQGERMWGEGASYDDAQRQAEEAYLRLRDSATWTTPEQVQATLALHVRSTLGPEHQALGVRVVQEVFAGAETGRRFGRAMRSATSGLTARQREELAKAAQLLAEGREQDDPEVRKHVQAAIAAGLAAERERREGQQD